MRSTIFICFLLLSSQLISVHGRFAEEQEEEWLQIIEKTMVKVSKSQKLQISLQNESLDDDDNDKSILDPIIAIPLGSISAYLGPKVINIISIFIDILSKGEDITTEELKEWGYEHGLNLLGMTSGALIGFKICKVLAISHPATKIAAILTLTYLGDQTVDFIKTNRNENLSREQAENVLKTDGDFSKKIIKLIQENYLRLTVFYISSVM